jgi:hypothetical protein
LNQFLVDNALIGYLFFGYSLLREGIGETQFRTTVFGDFDQPPKTQQFCKEDK